MEDVIYENVESDNSTLIPSEVKMFRRLTFERSLGLVQSEALLIRAESNTPDEKERRKNDLPSKSRKKGRKRTDSHLSNSGNWCLIPHVP